MFDLKAGGFGGGGAGAGAGGLLSALFLLVPDPLAEELEFWDGVVEGAGGAGAGAGTGAGAASSESSARLLGFRRTTGVVVHLQSDQSF